MPYNGIKAEAARQRLAEAVLNAQGQEFTSGRPVQNMPSPSSGFGPRINPVTHQPQFHQGVDLPVPQGTPVYATADGTVTANINASSGMPGGNEVYVTHPGGQQTHYDHLNKFAGPGLHGGPVRKGDLLGYSGSTGRSTGPHLHYGLYAKNQPIDPLAPMDADPARRYAGT